MAPSIGIIFKTYLRNAQQVSLSDSNILEKLYFKYICIQETGPFTTSLRKKNEQNTIFLQGSGSKR